MLLDSDSDWYFRMATNIFDFSDSDKDSEKNDSLLDEEGNVTEMEADIDICPDSVEPEVDLDLSLDIDNTSPVSSPGSANSESDNEIDNLHNSIVDDNILNETDPDQQPDSDQDAHPDVVDKDNLEFNANDAEQMWNLLTKPVQWIDKDFRPIHVKQFTQTTGPVLPDFWDRKVQKPIDYFMLFFTEETLDKIVHNTNLYANFVITQKKVRNRNYKDEWSPLTRAEFRGYLGIIILMGLK